MPRRFGTVTRGWIYLFLCARDGEHCALCQAVPTNPISATRNDPLNSESAAIPATLNGHSRRHRITLEIDHVDGNPRNNHRDNLRFLCKSCNVAESNRRRSSSDFSLSQKQRRRRQGNPATDLVRNTVEFSLGPPQMQANALYEPAFRGWVLGKFQAGADYLDKEDVINAGAEAVGCSIATAVTYLKKLTSSAGPLVEQQALLGGTIVVMKPELAVPDGDK